MNYFRESLNYGFRSLGIATIIIVLVSYILNDTALISNARGYYLLLFICFTIGKYFRLKMKK